MQGALQVINTMGAYMHNQLQGGQLIYPLVDENWQTIPGRQRTLDDLLQDINRQDEAQVFVSINLGGMIVLAGNEKGLTELRNRLPLEQERFPMSLYNHGAFHTPLMNDVAEKGSATLGNNLFQNPGLPMIDGRGAIWTPHSSSLPALWEYTLGQQVVDRYDFTKAVQVSAREYAPDAFIVLGPGNTLGSAVAQSLININ